ncbi:MAG: hypothetical protein PHY08_09205 [Candidatus Cloacimonetes bacterium]|nr:hypothetical protein [Candidatus Cloacimonadota bacterium]
MINHILSFLDKAFQHKWKTILAISFFSSVLQFLLFDCRDQISEYLIVNTIYQNGLNGFSGWLGIFFYDGQIYISQMGLHAFIFSLPAFLGVEPSSYYLWFLIISLTFLFFYIIISIAIEIKSLLNSTAALFIVLLILVNPIFLLDAGNLYWIRFFYFVPFYYVLKFYGKISIIKFYFYLLIILLVKFSINFEYSSTIVMSCLIPIALKSKNNFLVTLKTIFQKGVCTFFISIVSLSIIMSGLIINISLNGNKSATSLKDVVKSYAIGSSHKPHFLSYESRIKEWNGMYKEKMFNQEEDKIPNNEWDGVLKARESYTGFKDMLKYINFAGKEAIFYSLQFIICITISFLIVIYLFRKKTERVHLLYALVIAFLASISWVILMPLHFYLHSIYWRGYSDIVLVFPFYSTIVIIFGYILEKKFFNSLILNSKVIPY